MFRTFAALAGALVFMCTPAHAADDPVAAFAELPLIESPRLSPDGTRVASLLSTQGRQMLAITSVDGATPKLVSIGEKDDLVDWQWVNDEWLVMRLAASLNFQADLWRITRAYGVRASDAKIVSLARKDDAQQGADILWIARDGTPRILMAVQQSFYSSDEKFYPEVFEVDVSSGKRVSRMRPRSGVIDWFADSDGEVRMGYAYRDLSRTSSVYYRAAGGTLRTIDRASSRKGEELMDLPALFLPQPGRALAFSSRSGFLALYEMDLESHSLGDEVFSVAGYDIGSLVTDFQGRELLGVRYTDTQRRTEWFDPVMSRAQRELEEAFPDRSPQIVSFSEDGQRLIVHVGAPSDPGAFYLMDLGSRRVSRLGRVQPALEAFELGTVHTIRYIARDGLEIEAVLTLPPGQEPVSLPLIVMPHGGPYARDDESFDWWAQFLAHKGYAVLQPNYRGSSGYGSAFAARGEGEWGLAMQDDLLDGVDHLAAQGIADPARVCIAGGSYGGYAALRAVQRDGAARWRCAVSFAGVSDLAAMVREDSRYLNGGALRDNMLRQSPDFEAVSPLHGAAQFESPVLLVHGKKDLRVRFTQSSSMARRLQAAGKPVTYVELPQGDHHLRRAEDRRTLLGEMAAFLDLHNPVRLEAAGTGQ